MSPCYRGFFVNIVLIGYYGFGNAGDEAILASIAAQLRAQNSGVRLAVASGDVANTSAAHGVAAFPWNQMAELQAAIETADLVIIGGGGLFHDYWGADPATLLTGQHWGIAYYASCAFLAALFRKPLMLYAVGVGPLVSSYGARLTRAVCECAQIITVRDHASQKQLAEIGISPDRVEITADPAFGFQPTDTARLRDVVPAAFALTSPVLAVAARRWAIGVSPAFLESEIAAALDLFLDSTGGSVVLFPFQQIEGEVENDRAVADRILHGMRHRARSVIPSGALTPAQIFGAFRDCHVVLGMRLHALLFAAMAGVPSVALSYDPKIDAAAPLLGHGESPLDVRAVDAHTILVRLRQALQAKAPPLPGHDVSRDAGLAIALASRPSDALPPLQFSPDALDLLRRAFTAQFRLSAHTRQLEGAVEAFQSQLAEHGRDLFETQGRLDHAEQIRRAAYAEVERYRATFQSELSAYRNQRAWQVMLLFRKAYTLLTRSSKLAFFRWALGAAVGKFGSLAEYDLTFPDVSAYLPELFTREAAPSSPVSLPRHRLDIVILGIIDFDFRFQRPQQLAAELARRGSRVFWVSPSRFLPPSSPEPFQVIPLRENIWEVHMRCAPADVYLGDLNDAAAQTMASSLGALYREWNIAGNVVVAQLPFWRRLALRLRDAHAARILYDCMDDWETFQNMGAFNVSEEKHFARECDALIVTGAELHDKYTAQGLSPILVRNGADYDFFSQASESSLLNDLPRPIVGYFGAIADWIDLPLIAEVARRRPHYSFVLIGQVFGRDVSELEALPNVRLLGNKRYEDLPFYLHRFDACLIPFLINQVTKATDPVKLYEYFSLGKPVVATDMAELRQCGDLIYIARNANEYCEKLDEALSVRDRQFHEPRIAFAKRNTWSARTDQIDSAIAVLYPLVSILIVTYNSEEFVRPCLDSILRNTGYPHYEIVAVDNASTDGTPAALAAYGKRIRFIPLGQNTGFAGGNNRAAGEARGDFLLFLNIDTVVTPGWIARLLRHLESHADIGLICPVTNFAGNEVKINFDYRSVDGMEPFSAEVARKQAGKLLDIGVAPLYCALLSRKTWDTVGELDTGFGIGMFEDDDLSMRIRAAGLRVVAAEDCFVHHFGQGSFSKLPSDTYNALFESNRKRFEQKWKKPWISHRPRPGVRGVQDDVRFQPATFCAERL